MDARADHPSYPSADIERTAKRQNREAPSAASHASAPNAAAQAGCALRTLAPISAVEPGSPADDAGFTPGCALFSVDGHPIRDVIDWRWYAADDEITVGYLDTDGDEGEVELFRDEGEDWGFTFDGLVFDDVVQCRNNCTFCFMHQLPKGLRPSLTLRDDDFRLSFLVGTFVTLTNVTDEDIDRIIEQRITPLHVSLQASNPEVRRGLIGRFAARGLEAFDRLLAAGIEARAQIVLVPDVNDGPVLKETLDWAYARPGILSIGIVPLGYTRFQNRFDHSFDSYDASRQVLADIAPYQARAIRERGDAWVFAADEFYSNAYGPRLLDYLPPVSHYGTYELFEDGIGIIRSTVDDWETAEADGTVDACAEALRRANVHVKLVAGLAQRNFLDRLIARGPLAGRFSALYVENDFFGGNVNVTGLLVGSDIARAVAAYEHARPNDERTIYVVSDVVFNDDGFLLDDMRWGDMVKAAGVEIGVVSCSPRDYLKQIADIAADTTR